MDSYESMKHKLDAVGIYKIEDGTAVKAELCAYAAGLDAIFDTLDTMEKELFIDTAEDYGISERERFLGKVRDGYSLEKRREMLKMYEKKVEGGCTLQDFEDLIKGCGVENFTITEAPTLRKVIVKINDSMTDAEKKFTEESIKSSFPLHLTTVIDFTGD